MPTENISLLHTEQRKPDTVGLAGLSTLDMLKKINHEDHKVADAVEKALPMIEKAVDLIVPRMRKGGRMVYVGAGTSGRLGYMDAAECSPTYGVAIDRVACVMAGGHDAVFHPVEALEDETERAANDLKEWGLTPLDTVVAAAASGRTPYCVGALDYARSIGAGAVSISCNPDAVMSKHAEAPIEVDTGAEAILGSTRMKAGTAQKMIMNMLSTIAMVQLGRTCDNLMLCVRAKNLKGGNRIIRLFNEATGCTGDEQARKMLEAAEGRLEVAVLMQKTGKSREEAAQAIDAMENYYTVLDSLMK